MIKSRSFRAITITSLLLLFAATTLAQDTGILWGEALLRVFRDKAGLGPKPTYENRLKKLTIPTEPAVSEEPEISKEPAITKKPTQPTVSDISFKPVPKPVPRPVPKPAGDALLAMVPAESLFCVRINNFDYTLSQIDQFLAGVLPVPMMTSMLVRVQFAQLLGNPQLSGVNMAGSFAVFVPLSAARSADQSNFGILVPVTDYEQFVTGNANVSKPYKNGISKITSPGIPPFLATQVNSNYALVSVQGNETELIAMAKAMSEGKMAGLATALAAEAQKAVKESIWAYGNIELTQKTLGTEISGGLAGLKTMAGAMMPTGPDGTSPAAAAMGLDVENLMKQIRFLSLTLNPKPNVLNITTTISGVPGTKVAQTFSADSPTIPMLSQMLGAKDPKEMGPQLKSITTLIPSADKADFVGTYNLMNLFKLAMAFAPMPAPKMDMPAKSSMAFAVKVGEGALSLDIALPKEHLAEIAAVAMMMQPQFGASAGPNLEPFKDMSTWVMCRNPACKAANEMNLKEYHEFIQANADPRSPMPPAMVCKKCRQKSVFRAVKCAKCGFVFEIGTVRADFADRCPKCRYSKREQDRKKAAEARRTPPSEPRIPDKSFVIEPLVGMGKIRFGTPIEKAVEILGIMGAIPDRSSLVGTASTTEYHSLGLAIVTSDNTVSSILCGDGGLPNSPLIKACKCRTKKGIAMGSSRQEVMAAYGRPSSTRTNDIPGQGKIVVLEYNRIGAQFTLRDDKVVHMMFRKLR